MRIKIVNLNKVYPGGKKALKDLNLEIEPGMFGWKRRDPCINGTKWCR